METVRQSAGGSKDAGVEALRRAWALAPPEPELAAFVHEAVADDPVRLAALVRDDALERRRRGRPWTLEHYQLVLPSLCKPESALAILLIGLEIALEHSDPRELGARLGDGYAKDIADAVRRRIDADASTQGHVSKEDATPSGAATNASAPATDATATWHVISDSNVCLDHRSASPVDQPSGRHKGEHVGAYTLRRRLGEGGFGEVWLAERRSPDMTVAIKMLRPGRASAANRARFEAEAQALARLAHDSIARILDYGTGDEPYIVMEFVQGEPITSYCDRRRLSLQQRLELIARVCDAIHHAHSRQLLHRDLKPVNVLVTEVRCDPQSIKGRDRLLVVDHEGAQAIVAKAKIVDFGLAKSLDPGLRLADVTLTADFGRLMGTIEYMAPEQASHDPLGVDTRADIFAIGVVLYEIIAGVRPLPGEELLRQAVDQAIAKVRTAPRPEPSTRFQSLDRDTARRAADDRQEASPERLVRLLRGRLRHLTGTALRMEKEHRFTSAAAFARDLRHYLDDEPFEEAAAEAVSRRLWLAVRRRPLPFAAAATVTLCVLAALAALTGAYRIADAARREAIESERKVRTSAEVAEQNAAVAQQQRARADERADEADRQSYMANLLAAAERFAAGDSEAAHSRLVKIPADRRAWEWGHLMTRVDGASVRLQGHSSAIESARFSPDGRRIVTASKDGTARVWMSDGSGAPKVLGEHGSSVHSAAFSPDGSRIATVSADGVVRVWASEGPAKPTVLSGPRGVDLGMSAAFSPDGSRIVTRSLDDNVVRVWMADGSGEPSLLVGHDFAVFSATFSPDGKRVVTTSLDKTARIWMLDRSSEPLVLRGHTGPVRSAAFSPDGGRIVTASFDNTARVWMVDGSGEPTILRGHTDMIMSAEFSADGTRIVTASGDGAARVWMADGTGQPTVLGGHQGMLCSAKFSSDGMTVFTSSLDGTARSWPANGSGQPTVLMAGGGRILDAVFSPQGEQFLTESWGNAVRAWIATGAGEPTVLRGHLSDQHLSVVFSPDGSRIVTSSADGTTCIWMADGTGEPAVLKGQGAGFGRAVYSMDGTRLFIVSSDLTLWACLPDGSGKTNVFAGSEKRGIPAAISPDGTRVLTSLLDHSPLRVWTTDGSGESTELSGHEEPTWSAQFSPDGLRIVTASLDKTARVWMANGSHTPIVLRGHESGVHLALFSPDGSRILTVSADKTARVWKTDGSGVPVVLRGHGGPISTAAFSPDGTRVVTACCDGIARVWMADGSGGPTVLKGHQSGVSSAVFSPDGLRIVTESADETRVWMADGTGEPTVLRGHMAADLHAAMSPDGQRIVTTDRDDQTARVWMADGSGEPTVLLHDAVVASAAFSPDGSRIVTTTEDGTVRIWDSIPPAYRHRMKLLAEGRVTQADLIAAVEAKRLEPWEIEPLPWVLTPTLPGSGVAAAPEKKLR